MEKNIPQQDWSRVKNDIQKTWSNLNANDLDNTHGEINAIADLVTQKTGISHNEAERKLDNIVLRYRAQSSGTIEDSFEEQAP